MMTMDVAAHHQMYPTPLDVDQEVAEPCVASIHVVKVLALLHVIWLFYDALMSAASSFAVVSHIYRNNCHTWNTLCIVLHHCNCMLKGYS